MELRDWNLLVSTASDLSDLLPLFFLMRVSERSLKILRIYFLGSSIIKLITIAMVFGFGSPNTLPFYHILAVFEFTVLLFYFKQTIPVNTHLTYLILLVVIAFNVVNSVYFQRINEFNSYTWGVNTFALMVLAFLYLYTLYSRIEDIAIESHSGFIINAGLLIYFGGSLFTYLLGWDILSQKPAGLFANGWIIQAIANIFKNVIITYGITRSNSDR